MNKLLNRLLLASGFVVLLSPSVNAVTQTWINGSGDAHWSNPLNWSSSVPAPGDDVVFNNTSVSTCIVDTVMDNLASITVRTNYTGTILFLPNCVGGTNAITLSGDLIVNNGRMVFQGITNTVYGAGFTINAANVTIGSNGVLSADGQGFSSNAGLGAGSNNQYYGAGGASYGGRGGWSSGGRKGGTTLYGSVTDPTALGSGGGNTWQYSSTNGGNGGGAIALFAPTGIVTLNGTVTAAGNTGTSTRQGGGGSGGSIWIICNQLSGSGLISADGGAGGSHGDWGCGGGGGGGRVRLLYSASTFDGVVSVAGGAGGVGGLPVGQDGYPGTFSFPDGGNVTVKRSFALAPGSYNIPTLLVRSNAILSCQANLNTTSGVAIVASSVIVENGGSLVSDAQGFPAASGPGAGATGSQDGGGGGSYGGLAGCSVVVEVREGQICMDR